MKSALLVVALAATTLAAPRYQRTTRLDPTRSAQIGAAEQAWTMAEREADPVKQRALWEQAADAFAAVDGAAVDAKVKRDAAYAAVLAWKNALDVTPQPKPATTDDTTSRPLPPREAKLLAALDRFVKYADATDSELPGVVFLKARLYWRYGQLDHAIPILRTLVERHRQSDVVEYAANLLLDSYNRLMRFDDLVTLAETLAKDGALMKRYPELAGLVRRIRIQATRTSIEHLERGAHDLDAYSAIGTKYLELYNSAPDQERGDELLYNAGVYFERGRSIGVALETFESIQRRYPHSHIAARALARLGVLYATVAMYDKAAAKLEQYAKTYPGEKDAFYALSDAVYYRKATGDRAAAIADTKYVVKLFGAKRPREAAEALWTLTPLYDGDDAVKHVQEYLRTYGRKGPRSTLVIAHATLGKLLWQQSCPHGGVDGLCIELASRARTCGGGTVPIIKVIPRDPTKQKHALAAFADAIKLFERGSPDGAAARHAYARARLGMADADVEAYLSGAAGRAMTVEQLMTRLSDRQTAGAVVTRKLEAALTLEDPVGPVGATARLGLLAQGLASELATSAMPGNAREAPGRAKAYCDAVSDALEPLEERAATAFATCLAKAAELDWFDAAAAYCERELVRMKPDEFPPARELHGAAMFVAPVIASEPPPVRERH